MKIQVIRDGQEETLNPSGDILFTYPGRSLDDQTHHNLTFKILEASSGARLTINNAHINGSTFSDSENPSTTWTLASNDGALRYTGFAQQQAASGLASPTTYVSSAAGDQMSMQFNGSALTIYGPCGPSTGLMRVKIDNVEDTVNTTKPFQSDDCLLYQSQGFSPHDLHSLEVDNVDGRTLAVNRLEFFRYFPLDSPHSTNLGAIIAGVVVGVLLVVAAVVIFYSSRSKKMRTKINNSWKIFCS